MVQLFQVVAPRAKRCLFWYNTVTDLLFNSAGGDLVFRLAVPVRQPQVPPQVKSAESTNGVCDVARGAKRDKQIQATVRDKKMISPVISFSSLPTELHLLIFSFLRDKDIVSFAITNQYFLSIGRKCLEDFWLSFYGQWAGTNVVCVGSDVAPNDYPPGLFSTTELEDLSNKTCSRHYSGSTPFTLAHCEHLKEFKQDYPVLRIERDVLPTIRVVLKARGISRDPAYRHIAPQLAVGMDTYFPPDQKWILRNLTTKQIVRPEAIALSPDHIHGPDIKFIGFKEVIVLRTCWSTSFVGLKRDPTNISRGAWAGHRFDITTLSRHEVDTSGQEWTDASDEVAREIAAIWEGEYGPDWREIVPTLPSSGRRIW
jgi:hypothetical protein